MYKEVDAMHSFKLQEKFKAGNFVMGYYVLKESIVWKDKDQIISVSAKSSVANKKAMKLRVLQGALWLEDSFKKGEEILVYIDRSHTNNRNIEGDVCCIVSGKFFSHFVSDENPAKDLSRMKEILSLPENVGRLALAYVSGERKPDDEETISEIVTNSTYSEKYRDIIEPYMLPEQRVAYKTWSVFSVGSSNRNSEKIKYLMNISPAAPFRDREKVTYESIMEVFNRKIVGFENMKHTIAIYLAENQKKIRKRGVNILIHGLPGTGKTNLWGGAIAEALHLHHKIVNLGDKSSTLSLNGCEAPYDNSEPGILVKFFFKCRTSETVITWDELDKVAHIGEARGKDGHVMECLLPIFDPDRKTLGDAFLDEVPINLENTINICTANRVDNVAPELLNRMDMVFYMEPYDEKILLTIIHRNLPTIEKEYKLKSGWIRENALKRLIKYRSDFGARDIISGLKTMATYSRDNNGAIVTVKIVDGIMTNVVDMNNATVRFHYNEEKYSKEQKAEILETMTRRTCAENISEQERRALDLKAEYLTKLIPNNSFKFDPDVFFKSVNKKLWGMEDTKSKIAATLYATERIGVHREPILLVGPPGVGKTSLVEAIAQASGRKYIRVQMSGVKDSDFLMGNIPEQQAANSGKLVREMAKNETTAPLLYFDELEKISPETERCLFEIFDDTPKIHDRFLDCDVDLSYAQIVCSANDLSEMHPALLSRMKIVHVAGYSAAEKKHIIKDYLLPSVIKNLNVKMDDQVVQEILDFYQNDCGIRSVKHGLNTVVHNCLLEQRNSVDGVHIQKEDVTRILGSKDYVYLADKKTSGCVNGLATYGDSYGLVMPIRVTLLHNPNGEKRITGLPEAAIRDSVTLAETWLEEEFGIYLKEGFHIHFSPAGIKKDGPSAGLAIAIALLSAATGICVGNIAMSGEFDGKNVLPVGGAALKTQAAVSAGINKVYLPEGCRKDIDPEKFENVQIRFVKNIDSVVRELFPNIKKDKYDISKKVS